MHIEILLEQILILAVLVVAGVIGAKSRIITVEGKDNLGKLIFNITLPLLLFTNFSLLEFTPSLLQNTILSMALAAFSLFLALFVGWLAARAAGIKGDEGAVFKAQITFGNIVFLGFPLIYSLYGAEGLLYATAFQLVSNIMLYSVGVILLTRGKEKSIGRSLLRIFNPNTIAIVLGFLVFLFSVEIPSFMEKSLSGLGGTTIYLSMVYVGAMMFHSSIKGLILRKSVILLSLLKLIVIPVLLTSVLVLLGSAISGGLNPLVVSIVVLESAMPSMTIIIILARIYGSDDSMAMANVFVSTLISIVTIPAVLFMIDRFI